MSDESPKQESNSAAEPAAEPESTEGGEPAKRKRKRRRAKQQPAESPPLRATEDRFGNARAEFLLRFPQNAELEALIEAFEAGNYARVREEAPRLADKTEDQEVRLAAEDLARRIEPDPLIKVFLALALVLFLAIVATTYGSG